MRWSVVFLCLACACSKSAKSDNGDAEDDDTNDTSATVCKRGLAYGAKSAADLEALSDGVGWWYNWSPKPDETDGGLEFVPMIWGKDFTVDAAVAAIPANAGYLLGFNEPNFGSQSSIPADDAAKLWPQLESIADQRHLKLVSPAVNFCGGNCNDTDPFDYLTKFFAACDGCRVDYVAAHWYACDKQALTWYLGQLAQFGKPIWLTEFACLDGADTSVAKQQTYMTDAITILENDPNVFRYAWFTGRWPAAPSINLLSDEGTLTPLGHTYAEAENSCLQ